MSVPPSLTTTSVSPSRSRRARALLVVCFVLLLPVAALAQSDEIQVYTGELAAPGEASITVHGNYTAQGRKVAGFSGGIVPQGSVNGAVEWAYGVNDWFEAGAYLPVYSVTRDGTPKLDGVKARALFAVPHAEARAFFYGVNFELSYNAKHWDPSRFGAEIRPIVGARSGAWDFIANPILDTSFDGFGALVFAPSLRVANNITSEWALAVEHYAEFGQLSRFEPRGEQSHNVFAVTDFSRKAFSVEFGVGYGLTDVSDKFIVKAIIARSF